MLEANKLGALGMLLADALGQALGNHSTSAAAVLLTLQQFGPTTASALASIAGIAQPTAVRVTDGLVRRGLVERAARLGRTAPLRLTPAGEREAETLQAARLAAMQRLLDGLPEGERDGFMSLVDTLLAGATRSRGFARTTCRLCDHGVCDGVACPIGARATEIERGDHAC